MTERKRRAQTIVVGMQGHRVSLDSSQEMSVYPNPATLSKESLELFMSAPSLADVMRIAGERETVMSAEYGISDAIASEELAKASFVRSRMSLEVWGLLR